MNPLLLPCQPTPPPAPEAQIETAAGKPPIVMEDAAPGLETGAGLTLMTMFSESTAFPGVHLRGRRPRPLPLPVLSKRFDVVL